MSQSTPPHESGSLLSAALPWCVAIAAPVASWFAARSTAFAQLSKTVLDASRKLVEQTQTLHAQDGVRIVELEEKNRLLDLELLRKDGEIRQHLQQRDSVQFALAREQALSIAMKEEIERLEAEIEALEGKLESRGEEP